MATISTTVDVDLDEFDTDELIEELFRRKLDSEQVKDLCDILDCYGTGPPEDAVERATREEIAGRRNEALIWIERALGRFWIGRLAR